jgi:hypothetical protein
VASILDAHEIASNSQKPLILLTFPWWHLLRRYNTKRKQPIRVAFFLVAAFGGGDLSLTAFGTKA